MTNLPQTERGPNSRTCDFDERLLYADEHDDDEPEPGMIWALLLILLPTCAVVWSAVGWVVYRVWP